MRTKIRTKIYTKKGDRGKTHLADGRVVKKDNCLVEDIGTLDELNSSLGHLLAIENIDKKDCEILLRAQNNCFFFGAVVAQARPEILNKIRANFADGDTTNLEQRIDELTQNLPELKNFILPGGSEAAARAHVARTNCRRAERRLVNLKTEIKSLDQQMRSYLNRLSDYLFTLARVFNKQAGLNDVIWNKG